MPGGPVRVVDNDGTELRADFFVERDGDRLAVVLESFSGGDSSRPARNPDYRRTLRVLLRRLQGFNATPTEALVDSRDTQRDGIPEAHRRIITGDGGVPPARPSKGYSRVPLRRRGGG
jgi:hypothetical protein